jgi:hypothetical protein
MFILIENGELYCPEPRGRGSVLVVSELIEEVGRWTGGGWTCSGSSTR